MYFSIKKYPMKIETTIIYPYYRVAINRNIWYRKNKTIEIGLKLKENFGQLCPTLQSKLQFIGTYLSVEYTKDE